MVVLFNIHVRLPNGKKCVFSYIAPFWDRKVRQVPSFCWKVPPHRRLRPSPVLRLRIDPGYTCSRAEWKKSVVTGRELCLRRPLTAPSAIAIRLFVTLGEEILADGIDEKWWTFLFHISMYLYALQYVCYSTVHLHTFAIVIYSHCPRFFVGSQALQKTSSACLVLHGYLLIAIVGM